MLAKTQKTGRNYTNNWRPKHMPVWRIRSAAGLASLFFIFFPPQWVFSLPWHACLLTAFTDLNQRYQLNKVSTARICLPTLTEQVRCMTLRTTLFLGSVIAHWPRRRPWH